MIGGSIVKTRIALALIAALGLAACESSYGGAPSGGDEYSSDY